MNYQKLDAALSSVMSDRTRESRPDNERTLVVSVRTIDPPDAAQRVELERLGVHGVSERSRVFSAHLSPHAVEVLSEKPWVRLLSLARQLDPLKSDRSG